jgi:hypothetical protein
MALIDKVRPYFKGNEDASLFINELFAVWHIWDDLIDKDKPLSDEAINKAFMSALINLPKNRFYQTHFLILNPIMENAFINWIGSNTLEQSKGDLSIAFDLRNSYVNIITACANIIGGPLWAQEVAIESHKSLRNVESFQEYAAKLNTKESA